MRQPDLRIPDNSGGYIDLDYDDLPGYETERYKQDKRDDYITLWSLAAIPILFAVAYIIGKIFWG